jgi:hypothetical protein
MQPHQSVGIFVPPSSTGDDLAALQEARRLVRDLHEYFAKREPLISREQVSFMTRIQSGQLDLPAENLPVARLYEQVASWLDEWQKSDCATFFSVSGGSAGAGRLPAKARRAGFARDCYRLKQ